MKVAVDLGSPLGHQNGNKYKYEMKLDFKVPSKPSFQVLFPCHPVKTKQHLNTSAYRSCAALNAEINERLKASTVTTTLTIGDFQFTGIKGNIYLIWTKTLRKINRNAIEVVIHKDTPVLFAMDGYGNYSQYIFIFKDRLKITRKECQQLHFDARYAFFCLESDVRLEKPIKVHVVHDSQSTDIVTNEIHDDVDHGYNSSDEYDELVFGDDSSMDELNNNNL